MRQHIARFRRIFRRKPKNKKSSANHNPPTSDYERVAWRCWPPVLPSSSEGEEEEARETPVLVRFANKNPSYIPTTEAWWRDPALDQSNPVVRRRPDG